MSKSTPLLLVVAAVMVLCVPGLRGAKHLASIQDRRERYPVAEYDETEPADLVKRDKLRKQKQLYDKDAPFGKPGPTDHLIAFWPDFAFDFPALPFAKSDAVVVGAVLSATAHRSENKRNVFSNFEVRVDEVLKGNKLTTNDVINVQRLGGFVKYPDGRQVAITRFKSLSSRQEWQICVR